MKIAMLAPESSPSWGGVGSYTYNLIRNLPDDVEVHIITIDRKAEDSYEKILSDKRVHIHKIVSISPNESFFYNLKFQMAVFMKLKKLHKLYNFDLIHSHSGHLPHYFSQFQNIAPLVVTVHGETKGLKKARKAAKCRKDITESLNDLFSPIIEFGEKINFKRAHRLLPISEFTLRQINEQYGVDTENKAHVIYNGVDTDLFKPMDVEMYDQVVITFIGRLYAIKGLDIFLKSISTIIKQGYKIKLLLVGRGNINYLKKFCSSFMHQNSYSIIGRVNYRDMPKIYNPSDVVALPSIYEGCSGAILETLSCGKIVIASKVGGTPEIIKDGYNGILFRPGDSQELANKIISVIEETIDIEKIRKNARKTAVEKFDWKDKGKEVYGEYLKVLDE